MLDDGNFVLADKDSVHLWESFDVPTDTLLPNQALKKGNSLVSRSSETNYSEGRFQAILRDDGNFVLFLMDFPYWDTFSTHLGNGSEMIFKESGSIYLARGNGWLGPVIEPDPIEPNEFYQRASLDSDGVFRRYLYPKAISNVSVGTRTWFVAANSSEPQNICARFASVVGSNNVPLRASPYCGFNSYCVMSDDKKPQCKCTPGYVNSESDNEVPISGCKPSFHPHECNEISSEEEAQNFTLTEVLNMEWPQFDYFLHKETEEECKEDCLRDCYCAVAVYQQGICSKKKQPLTNGWIDPLLVGIKSFIKVGKDPVKLEANRSKKNHSGMSPNGALVLGSLAVLNLIIFSAVLLAYFLLIRRKASRHQSVTNISKSFPETGEMNLRNFDYKELEEATEGFKEELGRGASSTVYKGFLDQGKRPVAVKRIDKIVGEGEREFKTEVSAIRGTNHKNLVRLLGFCNEGQHKLLVYEFMSNGSLARFLFGSNSKPNWEKRMRISMGTAKALLYLHEECNIQIIHCDIKPQNILLDDSFLARVSDFGLAKLLRLDQTRTVTGIRGTRGYVAPEWFKKSAITSKVDVYSFGVVLLEIVCCRKNVELDLEDENKIILSDWAYDRYREGRLDLLLENDEDAKKDVKTVERFVKTALWCTQEDPLARPCMKKVIQMLEGVLEIPLPPDPSSV
ncbi:G-type lectin S-receptor-like serine/threonine-protein kinase RLK1 [Morus notabilis]|uniref:non-specific serine/threonine protein kinase n=1 Tax=Morus notabilis TaxID=981085 RepID=W9QD77_9ROSA|nr:G-type lectin S-receptor-like serine/threonine-protein kinase RLK1 [Morus notabilis]